jgi:predicted negative regulator of RcsB-dependent stress response
LQLALAAVLRGKFDEAQDRLKWASEHASDPGIAAVARLRMAQVSWQLGKPDDALADLAKPPTAFAGVYQQLSGDILLSMNRRAEAKRAYSAALSALPPAAPDRANLQHAIDNLSDVAAAS